MDKSTWRSKAKHVVYLQSVFLGFSLILVVLCPILLWDGTFSNFQTGLLNEINEMLFVRKAKHYLKDLRVEIPSTGNDFEKTVKRQLYLAAKVPIFVWWVAYVFFVNLVGAQWWIAGKLRRAIKSGTAPGRALRNARTWRKVFGEVTRLKTVLFLVWIYGILDTTGRLRETCGYLMIVTLIDFIVSFYCYFVVGIFVRELEWRSSNYGV